jgi:hypothetical protein
MDNDTTCNNMDNMEEIVEVEESFTPGEICVKCGDPIVVLYSEQDGREVDFFCRCHKIDNVRKRFSYQEGFEMFIDEDEYEDYQNKEDDFYASRTS